MEQTQVTEEQTLSLSLNPTNKVTELDDRVTPCLRSVN